MIGRSRVATLLVVLLVVATLPTGVAAQQSTRDVLLDEDARQVATVTIDGQAYDVYRIENVVWYASGIEIYADGERVTAESTARRVLERLAQRRAIDNLQPADLDRLRAAKRNVSRAHEAVATGEAELEATLAHLERLRSERLNGTTAYNASVEAAPAIEEINESGPELRADLEAFRTDADAFVENATTLVRLVERRANGTSVDPQRVYDVYVATVRANDALSEHLGYSGIDERLGRLADRSRSAAANVESVGESGNETAAHLDRLANASGTAANRTAAIDLPGFAFEDTQDHAIDTEAKLMDRWHSRQNARSDVRNTLLGLVVISGAGVGYVGLKRR